MGFSGITIKQPELARQRLSAGRYVRDKIPVEKAIAYKYKYCRHVIFKFFAPCVITFPGGKENVFFIIVLKNAAKFDSINATFFRTGRL